MTHRPIAPEGRAAKSAAGSAEPGCAPEARPYVLAATIVASAMAFIDGSVVNIALPAIQRDLAAGIADLQWVINAYLLLLGALILVGGGLGDRVGRRLVFLVGIALFTIASIACALAPSIGWLIAVRAVQGIGAALLVPQSLAIITASFPKDVRGKAIGTWAAASAVTTALGPPIGGFLIDLLSWRVAFWINLPLAVLALWLIWRYVPESRDDKATGPVDWLGAVVATLAFGALTYGLIALSDEAAGRLAVAAPIILGLVGIGAFVAIEARAANPIMPPTLFHSRVFTGTNIVTVFLYGSLAGTLFLMPFDLLARRGLTATEAGLTLLPVGIIIGLLSRTMGGLADKYGPRLFLIAGPILVGASGLILAFGQGSYWLGVMLPILMLSFGMALVVSPLTTAVMNAAEEGKSGAASGVNNAASRLAGVIAIAVFGAAAAIVFAASAPAGTRFGVLPAPDAADRATVEGAFIAAYRTAMIFSAVWSFLAALAAFLWVPGTPAGDSPPVTPDKPLD